MNHFFRCAAPLLTVAMLACESVNSTNNEARIPDTENEFSPEAMAESDALSYFRDKALNLGWNLGNTLDAHSGGVSNETVWGNPKANQAIFNGIKAAGFDVVRIPVTWMGHIGKAPDYHIEEQFLKRVAEVVAYAHKAGLAVIINLHHDGSTEKKNNVVSDNGWLSINQARKSEEGMRQVSAQFERVWTQIAVYFKNFGDYLIFESLNEVHDGNWGWGTESEQRPQYEIVNQWNQLFVNAVRKTGGNNTGRFLVIPGYCTVPKHTVAGYFKLPQDSGNTANKLIVTFHYYDPYEFGIAGTRQEWGSEADKNKVNNDFAPFKTKFVNNGIPVIIGESGAVLQNKSGHEQTRIAYLAYVYGKAHENGLTPIYWDNGSITGGGEKFGLFNRQTGEPNSEGSRGIIQAMVNAVK